MGFADFRVSILDCGAVEGSGMIPNTPPENEHPVPEFRSSLQGSSSKNTVQGDVPGGYLAPNGEFIPQDELERLAKGVKNEDGDTVYFKPSFIEGAWSKFEPRREQW